MDNGSVIIFNRFRANIPENQCEIIEKILKKYVLGLVVSRNTGDVLYNIQVDPEIKMELISQFIAALAMFGEENVGHINRIFIGGLNIELSIVQRHNLILTLFFRPNMVKDYLEEEAQRGLDLFYEKFKEPITQKKNNKAIYETFDNDICQIILDYLIKIGVLKEGCDPSLDFS
ncbi:MAG: hypothetical protein DRO88_07020 [Promethearchaeia archaeon]|nr:MAG: hypothetical protein DRO88_07020 [Candidatus Lokiarchaeia archaeon]